MFSADKLKCPKCQRQVLKKVIAVTKGKCNNCGYKLAGTIMGFVPKPKSTMDMLNDLSV